MESNKIELAQKSKEYFVQMVICLCLLLFSFPIVLMALFILKDGGNEKELYQYILILIVYIALFIKIVCSIVKMKIRPQIAIECDETGIYLNYRINKIVYIAYQNIKEVRSLRGWNRSFTRNSFGKIIVVTKDSQYSMNLIDEVEHVKHSILDKIHTYSNNINVEK